MNSKYDIIIIGGGAAGFFTAINIVEKNSKLKVAILERGKSVLEKVRISGGGRCNVTHACFVPNDLVKFYQRGENSEDRFINFVLEIRLNGLRNMELNSKSRTMVECFQFPTHRKR